MSKFKKGDRVKLIHECNRCRLEDGTSDGCRFTQEQLRKIEFEVEAKSSKEGEVRCKHAFGFPYGGCTFLESDLMLVSDVLCDGEMIVINL
jgi:hypothetical protein